MVRAAVAVRSYGTALFVVILLVVWQLLAALVTSLAGGADRTYTSRFRHRLTGWGAVYCLVTGLFCLVSMHWGMNLLYLTSAFLLGGVLCAAVFPRVMLSRVCSG